MSYKALFYPKDFYSERIFLNQVPCVTIKLSSTHSIILAGTEYLQRSFSSEERPQHNIKSYEMVYVGMCYKDVGYLLDIAWAQPVYESEVKEEGAFFP